MRMEHSSPKKKRTLLWTLFTIIVSAVAGFAVLIGFANGIESVLKPEKYYFYEFQSIADMLMEWLIMVPVMSLVGAWIGKLTDKEIKGLEEDNDFLYLWNHLKRYRVLIILLWMAALYCCATSVTFVGENRIVFHSPLHPLGISYHYSDVAHIDTGFGQKRFALCEYKKKGNFYYQITVDGKKAVFHVPDVNEEIPRYEEDSYLELEDFDRRLVAIGIPKESDGRGWEHCDLDKQYVDRFRRIIARR